MSVYNGERFLRKAIDSILAQSYQDFEFLIINDASTDTTQDILNEYAAKDSRIHVINNEVNIGLTASLNKGLAVAKGQFIARMDADDISLPSRFKKQVRFLQENPVVLVVGSWIAYIDENDKETMKVIKFPLYSQEISHLLINKINNNIAHSAAMFRKKEILTLGGYRTLFVRSQDYDLWLRLSECGDVFANLPEKLLLHRVHKDAISVKAQVDQARSAIFAWYGAVHRRRGEADPEKQFDSLPDLADLAELVAANTPEGIPLLLDFAQALGSQGLPLLYPFYKLKPSNVICYQCPNHNLSLQYNSSTNILECPNGCVFPIIKGIPRFVSAENYASSFGLQWNTFRKTQLDSYTNTTISRDRLSRILGGLDWLKGKTVLEAGCGAGRFSEVLLEAGALLYSLDLSSAVEAAKVNCSHFSSHHICQASILAMPFLPESFDVVICIGVIQHTPNPEECITALTRMVKPGGKLFIDHYAPGFPMPLMRRILRNFLLGKNPEYCMHFCTKLRNLLWPLHVYLHINQRKRFFGIMYHLFYRFSPIVDHQNAYSQLSLEILREWALLDTHDLLTDVYKHLRTTEQISKSLVDNGLDVIRCVYAGNGVEAEACKNMENH